MKLTKNLKIFAVINAVTSVAFFYLLNAAIEDEAGQRIAVLAIGYGLTWFFTGLILGKNDDTRSYRGNLGLMYHLVTTVIVVLTSIWASVFLEKMEWVDTAWVLGSMGVSLLVHWLATRNDTKGIDKKEAFK